MLILVEDPEAMARFTDRVPRRLIDANYSMLTRESPRFAGFFGSSGGGKTARKIGLLKIGPRRRRRIARHAARVRWARHRARQAAAEPKTTVIEQSARQTT